MDLRDFRIVIAVIRSVYAAIEVTSSFPSYSSCVSVPEGTVQCYVFVPRRAMVMPIRCYGTCELFVLVFRVLELNFSNGVFD